MRVNKVTKKNLERKFVLYSRHCPLLLNTENTHVWENAGRIIRYDLSKKLSFYKVLGTTCELCIRYTNSCTDWLNREQGKRLFMDTSVT